MIRTRRDDIVENFHGTEVADPYRWLEDAESAEVQTWTQAQNEVTRAFLDMIPQRQQIRERLQQLWDYPKQSIPTKRGGRYFFARNPGLLNQAILYVQPLLDAEPVELLDPNTLSEDGTIATTRQSYTKDGRLMAYAVAESGSDWQTIRVRDVDTQRDLPDIIHWCKFTSISWMPDGSGFFYSRYPEPGTVAPEDESHYSRVYFHAIGTTQADDALIYERPDFKELLLDPDVTEDGQYLVITASVGTDPRTRIYYRELGSGTGLIPLLDKGDAKYLMIDNDGPVFYIQTDLDAPRGKLVAIDTRQPGREHWREVVPEGGTPLDFVVAAGEHFVVGMLIDAQHKVDLYRRDGTFDRQIELPTIGAVEAISGTPGDPELFLGFTSFLYPSTPFRYDLNDPDATLTPLHESGIDFDPEGYETKQVFFHSTDGTRVPMFLVHKKDLDLRGDSPTLLYGYGGFNISLTPSFSIHRLVWLERCGVFALANLRGGEEYGEEWHRAGMLEHKQNVFDDFISAAEWLIGNGYTNHTKLAINGGSNGGLLVAACLTQRPDLYGAAVCEVPVIDMLRYHRFTIGHFWVPEYGNAEEDPEHFRFMYAYSPLHNVREGTKYPPTLILSADSDDRVVPAHAKKFTATLQAAQGGDAPILLRIETRAGHGLGKPTTKILDERADVYAFLSQELGMVDER
jgi:prolyl oligopeptidase